MSLFLCIFCSFTQAQQKEQIPVKRVNGDEYVPANARLLYWQTKETDSGKYIIYYYSAGCKVVITSTDFYSNDTVVKTRSLVNTTELVNKKVKFLTAHGNISYEFYSRSKDEVAINNENFHQHTERIYMDVLLKEKYPIRVNFTSRQSNSPFFKNFYDVNFQFDKYAYNRNLKQQLLTKLNQQTPQYKYPDLANAENQLKKEKEEYAAAKNWVNAPATLQKLIEEKEHNYYKKLKAKEDSLAGLVKNAKSTKIKLQSDSSSQNKDLSLSKSTGDSASINMQIDSLALSGNTILAKSETVQANDFSIKDSLVHNIAFTKIELAQKTGSITENNATVDENSPGNLSLIKNKLWDKIKNTTEITPAQNVRRTNALSAVENNITGTNDKTTASDNAKKDSATAKLNAQKDKISDSVSSIKNKITGKKDSALAKITAIKDSATAKLKAKEDKVTDSLASIKNKITAKKDSALSKVTAKKDSATAKLNAKKDKLTDSLSSIKNKLSNRKNSITQKAGNRIDSIAEPFMKKYEKKKHDLDSLQKRIDSLTKKADSIRNKVEKSIQTVRQKINGSANEKDLQKIAADNGINLDKDGKLQKSLSAIKTFSIGRSMINYTELTAQNITVTGINIEYNPSYYAAFAAGKIDYRFRDFLGKNKPQRNNQYIVMGRLGIGDKDHKALIFSYFTGRKNTADFSLSDSVKNYVNITGYSLEAIYKKDENTGISAEFAKSTKPVTGSFQSNKESGSLVRFSDKSNMGINIKAQTIFPETNTRISGFFRKTGENFQSFSLFSYNTDQTAWLIKADQPFLKNKISVTAMLRRNDFTNPFTDKTYKTSTVFKSIQVNIRFPKYPSVSIGYYPGTQLYMINKERIRESAYYILNGTANYSYFLKRISMNSLFVYNRYSNEATDSGFIAYKGINYYALQTLFLKKFQLQGGYSYAKQPELQFYSVETSIDYALRNWLKLGAGLKYNNISGGNNYWGERGQLSIKLRRLGEVQLQYEKSYLPTINQTLYPVEIGRLSYFKNF